MQANRGLGLTAHIIDHCNLILKFPEGTNSTWVCVFFFSCFSYGLTSCWLLTVLDFTLSTTSNLKFLNHWSINIMFVRQFYYGNRLAIILHYQRSHLLSNYKYLSFKNTVPQHDYSADKRVSRRSA